MALPKWQEITPEQLHPAVEHLKKAFRATARREAENLHLKCYKDLHSPTKETESESSIFRFYRDAYSLVLSKLAETQFKELLQIARANARTIQLNPIEWAATSSRILLQSEAAFVAPFVKACCDKQERQSWARSELRDASDSFDTWLEGQEVSEMMPLTNQVLKTMRWADWLAPRFITMEPSGNAPYDAACAWDREDERTTANLLEGLSDWVLLWATQRIGQLAGAEHVQAAKIVIDPEFQAMLDQSQRTIDRSKRLLDEINSNQVVAPMKEQRFPGEVESQEARVDATEKSQVTGQLQATATGILGKEALRIKQFIERVSALSGRKVTKKDIWLVAGYGHRTEFERFQRGNGSNAAIENFNRVLSMAPADFLRNLVTKQQGG